MALVSIKEASFGYEGKPVLREVSLSVCAGDYLCIMGENGSGKSTLMKTMLGLLPLIQGKIEFGDGLRQKEIGYLPQQTDAQKDFPASVREIVLSGCLNRCGLRPFYRRSEKELARANMERLGISGLSRRCHRELSGGQQQRVLLARALCATQKLLLLDEPAAGLDPKASEDMYQIIERLNKDSGIAIVMISHDIGSAMKYASHILHLGSTSLF
ncbi:ABC transporter ATP-binding protein [Candidatus Saccharibacteria bacterium]|nr:ABC transporter ATP-binding protein [Candidatus Saccharibacteria bacterium]